MFQDGWVPLIRIATVGTLSYIAVVALLRYFGKRALTKMNAFDMAVTVAVGSSFASAVMNKEITLADGVFAFILLLVLQRLFASLSGPPWLVWALLEGPAPADRLPRQNPLGCGEERAIGRTRDPRRNSE